VRDRRAWAYGWVGVVSVALAASGCGWLLGLDEFVDAPPVVDGQGGSGGGCEPREAVGCYEGPAGTEGVGICAAGTRTCNADGTGYGACEDQATPAAETCANPADEDCDGHDCVLWARMFGDINNQQVTGMALDREGNIYVTGRFNGTLAFDPAKPLESVGTDDAYLAKLTASGAPLWSKAFPHIHTTGVITDSQGNVILSGVFKGSLSFGGATHETTGDVQEAAFVARFKPDGAFSWSEMYENGEERTYVVSPAVDPSDAVILFGRGYCTQICGLPAERLWLRRYRADGTLDWSKNFPYSDSGGERHATGVTTDSEGNIVLTGSFGGPYGSPSTSFGGPDLTTAGGADAFLVKLTSQGDFVWQRRYGDSDDQRGMAVACDSAGNILVAGTYAGAMQFGNKLLSSAGMDDIFVAKLSGAGGILWARSFGSPEDESVPRLAAQDNGSVVLTARTMGPIDFDGGELDGAGGLEMPLVKLAPDGAHIWSKVFGDAADQVSQAVVVAPGGEVVLAGDAAGAVNLGGIELFSTGGSDVLITRLAR